jgi:hypothetical protein
MNIYFIIIGGVVTIIQSAFFIRTLMKIDNRITTLEKITNELIENKVENVNQPSLVKGVQQIRDDDEKYLKMLEMSRTNQIMNHNSIVNNSFDTDGDLIPDNLSKEELDVLKMFYEKNI